MSVTRTITATKEGMLDNLRERRDEQLRSAESATLKRDAAHYRSLAQGLDMAIREIEDWTIIVDNEEITA